MFEKMKRKTEVQARVVFFLLRVKGGGVTSFSCLEGFDGATH